MVGGKEKDRDKRKRDAKLSEAAYNWVRAGSSQNGFLGSTSFCYVAVVAALRLGRSTLLRDTGTQDAAAC